MLEHKFVCTVSIFNDSAIKLFIKPHLSFDTLGYYHVAHGITQGTVLKVPHNVQKLNHTTYSLSLSSFLTHILLQTLLENANLIGLRMRLVRTLYTKLHEFKKIEQAKKSAKTFSHWHHH